MYWQSRFDKIKFGLFYTLLLTGLACEQKKGIEAIQSIVDGVLPTVTPTPKLSNCYMGYPATQTCLVNNNSSFTYTEEYGGRSLSGLNISSGSNLVVSIATGYYYNKNIEIWDDNLQSPNIKQGVSLFGIIGTLPTTGSFASCSNNYPMLSGSPLGKITESDCATTGTFFYYSQEYGGRTSACEVDNNGGRHTAGKCWYDISSGTYYWYNSPISYPDCTLASNPDDAEQSVACIAQAGKYIYNQSYNGRGLNCETEAVNSVSCWLAPGSYYIRSQNFCNEVTAGTLATDGKNLNACLVKEQRYYYSQAWGGGGREEDCIADRLGPCWVNEVSKGSLELDLVASNIKSFTTIFGVEGEYNGTTFAWGSGAHRAPSGTSSSNRMTYKQESVTAATTSFATDYHAIPKIADSSEGVTGGTVDRSSWANISCGTTGGINARINNCSTALNGLGSGSVWQGAVKGNAGQGKWTLISRNHCSGGICHEVWRDDSTELLWSSLVSSWANWCYASGNSNSSAVDEARRDSADTTCSSFLNQAVGENAAYSACYEGSGYGGEDGFINVTGGTVADDGKTGLTSNLAANSGRVFWRLPSIYDYMLANHNGIRFVLPDINSNLNLWTSTSDSMDRTQAWMFNQKYGYRARALKTHAKGVRCVGR